VNIIEGGSWAVIDESKGLFKNDARALAVDEQGGVWVGQQGGASCFLDGQWKYLRAPDLGSLTFDALACDQKGRVWAGHYQGLQVFDGRQWKSYPRDAFGAREAWGLEDLAIGPDGSVWIATHLGVICYDGSAWTRYDETSGLASRSVDSIAVDSTGRVWVGHVSGVSALDQGKWINYGAGGSAIDVKVPDLTQANDLAIDGKGSLWVVTFGNGVFSFDGRDWKKYDRSNSGLIGGRGKVIACDAAGGVWVGTDYELAVFDGSRWWTYTAATSGLAADGISAIACIGAGRVELPVPRTAAPGSVTGRVVTGEGAPIAEAEVFVCWDVSWPIFTGPTPCRGTSYHVFTDNDGRFVIQGISMGAYRIAIKRMEKGKAKWYSVGGIGSIPTMVRVLSGKDTYFGELKLKTD